MVSTTVVKKEAEATSLKLPSAIAILSLSVIALGLALLATGLPGGMVGGMGGDLRRWLLDMGASRSVALLAVSIFRARMWVGFGLVVLGCLSDHFLGMRRVWEILKDCAGSVQFIAICFQLVVLTWICRRFQLEHEAFFGPFLLLTATGFVIHFLLPASLRLQFFILLSLVAYVTILGWRDAVCLSAISVLLIGLARLPISQWVRIALLLLTVGGLIYLRASSLSLPWSDAVWPILWSMFLFRMIIYLFDLKHGKAPTGWRHALAYFFLLPNVVFPLFPPVDYTALWRNYYTGSEYRTYQQGVHWMLVGVLHLLVYRYIDYNWIETPETIKNSRGLLQYMVSNYLLIIRLSGQFHMIVGILHLFGFHLPRSMDHYFLSTGFTDYWRRVNIYWKDFIQKVIYYPAIFRMRSLGNTAKISIATLIGFLATWFFHSCQWFGLRGAWFLSSTDIFFWSSLAVLVLGSSLIEAKYGRKRSLVQKRATFREIAVHGLKATLVFVVMSVLWSIWISPSMSNWFNLVVRSRLWWVDVVAGIAAIAAILTSIIFLRDRLGGAQTALQQQASGKSFARAALRTVVPMFVLAVLGTSQGVALLPVFAQTKLSELRVQKLNKKHDAMQFQGYYEQLNDVNDFNFRLYELYSRKSQSKGAEDQQESGRNAPKMQDDDLMGTQLVPNLDIVRNNKPFRTNQWGMRDKEYTSERLPQSMRIALLGGSISMARGVDVEDSYETLLEERLNKDWGGKEFERYEILNISVGAHGVLQRLGMLETKAIEFQPQVVFFTSHIEDSRPDIRHLSRTAIEQIPYKEVVDLIESAGVVPGMASEEIQSLLFPKWDELLSTYFRKAVELCHRRGIKIVLVVIPSRPQENDPDQVAKLVQLGSEAGFDVTFDLSGIYNGYPVDDVRVSSDDNHPNAMGHRLIYERLYRELNAHRELFQNPSASTTTESRDELNQPSSTNAP